jgi:NAD(P)-dependent dehydrogenase (short-subunit alcohol dehydrogenase family)
MQARGGAIINVASVAGLTASPRAAHYGAAKAALVNLTKTLALEWAPKIRVNCVAPDFIRTEGTEKLMSTADRRRLARLIPLRRLGSAVDVANAVAFLASDMASFVTGQVVVIDGGSFHRARLDFMPSER